MNRDAEPDAASATIAQVLEQANLLSEAGAYDKALALLDRALDLPCADPELHTARGWALENLDPARLPEARRAYESAIALDAGLSWARLGLASVLERLGEVEAARRAYLELVDHATPRAAQQPDLMELLGWSQYRLGRLDEAVDTFRRALAHDEAWISVRFDLGLALLVRGDAVDATREYQAALTQLAARQAGRRLGPLRVALDDLDEAQARLRSAHASAAADNIRALLGRAANEQRKLRG